MEDYSLPPLENYAVIDEHSSHASVEDIAQFRGRVVEPDYKPEYEESPEEDPRSNRVDDRTLRPDYSIGHGGGSRNKGRKQTVKPISGPERARRAELRMNRAHVDPETPEQRIARKFTQLVAEMNEASPSGRPRKNKELLESCSISASPEHEAAIKAAGMHTPEDLIAHAERMRPQ